MQKCESLEKLLKAADNHGEDAGEPDHTVGDLQDLLRCAWDIMSVSQKIQFLKSDEVDSLVELGGRNEFTAEEEVDGLRKCIDKLEQEVKNAGYIIHVTNTGYYWEDPDGECSEDFRDYSDAVVSAGNALSEVTA